MDMGPESSAYAGHHLLWARMGGTAKKAVTEEEVQSEWIVPAPKFAAPQPEVTEWSVGMRVPSRPVLQFPAEDCLQLPLLRPLNE